MLSDRAEMVRRDGVSDRDVGTGEVGVEAVEVLAESLERAAVEGQIGRVEADVDGAVKLAGQGTGELSKGTQQIMEVARMGVVLDEPIGQPGLRIVGGDLDRIANQFGLQLRRLLRLAQA